jgi:xanthine/uracil permease
MQFKYGLDERPPAGAMLLFGLQWFAVTIPILVIIGKITAGFHFESPEEEILYLQKLTFMMAIALFAQVLAGHRLPLIIGPSTVLLIGIISSSKFGADAIYTSIMAGGLLLSLLSITGLFGHLRRLFTTRVVAAVLLLIAFTLTPTILNLITSPQAGHGATANLSFAVPVLFAMFVLYRYSRGIWKSTVIIWAMILGSLIYSLLFPDTRAPASILHGPLLAGWMNHLTSWTVDIGVLISFAFCYLALAANDLGSIQSMNDLLKASDQPRRLTRGIFVTGLANIFAGLLGVIGPVNFSLSPGIIASTRCASRLTLLPTAFMLLLLSFSPAAVMLLDAVPAVMIGCVLLFILCAQIAAGLTLVMESPEGFQFETGLILGLPILLGTVTAFLPSDILDAFPAILWPIVGNGFVIGVTVALVLEHLIFRKA